MTRGSIDSSSSTSPHLSPIHHSKCSTHILIFVLHGGNILDSGAEPLLNKKSDFTTFKVSFENIIKKHYSSMSSKIVFRLINIPPICANALAVLSSLSPYSFQSSPSAIDGHCHSYDAVPVASLPIFAVSSQDYQEQVSKTISSLNSSYHDFLKSEEGLGFDGQVVLIGDSIGSIVGFDVLCRNEKDASEKVLNDASQNLNNLDSIKPSLNFEQKRIFSTKNENRSKDCHSIDKSNSKKTLDDKLVSTTVKSHVQIHENDHSINSYLQLLSTPLFMRNSLELNDCNILNRLEFEVSDFFMFGSSLGLVLTFRKMLFLENINCNNLLRFFF